MEKELRKAFEETTTNNLKATIEYTKTTRKMVREQAELIKSLNQTILNYEERFDLITKQLAAIQMKMYRGGGE